MNNGAGLSTFLLMQGSDIGQSVPPFPIQAKRPDLSSLRSGEGMLVRKLFSKEERFFPYSASQQALDEADFVHFAGTFIDTGRELQATGP